MDASRSDIIPFMASPDTRPSVQATQEGATVTDFAKNPPGEQLPMSVATLTLPNGKVKTVITARTEQGPKIVEI